MTSSSSIAFFNVEKQNKNIKILFILLYCFHDKKYSENHKHWKYFLLQVKICEKWTSFAPTPLKVKIRALWIQAPIYFLLISADFS